MSDETMLLDEFVVERKLGAGGMGEVVLVRSRWTGHYFAVKRASTSSPEARDALLSELRTWSELPEHPHLVPCRFFRTLSDEVAIFAEYIEGGSLAEWISQGRLSLEARLDVAIQMARGLEAVHRLGVIHRDVKPANVLMTLEGVARLADFGLAAGQRGMTPGYCSPEQAERVAGAALTLTPATDQWSWGVSVLELFAGAPPCRYGGQFAGEVLESFLSAGGQLPDLLIEVLRRCFQRRPAERWQSLGEVAEVVAIAYQMALGTPYTRACPPWPTRAHDSEQVARLRALTDLQACEEPLRRLTSLVRQGQTDREFELAELCLHKAALHREANDQPGAARLTDRAIALLEPREADRPARLIEACLRRASDAPYPLALTLAGRALVLAERWGLPQLDARMRLARTLYALEDYPATLAELDRARAVADETTLAELALLTGRVLKNLGDLQGAGPWLDDAITRLERRGDRTLLAGAYRTRARLRSTTDDWTGAERDAARSLDLDAGDADDRAEVLALRAGLCLRRDRADEALPLYVEARSLLEQLVGPQGRLGHLLSLANVCLGQALALRHLGEPAASLDHSQRAIALLEPQVVADRHDLASDLARAQSIHAQALIAVGASETALPHLRAASVLYAELVQGRGRRDLLATFLEATRREARALAVTVSIASGLSRIEETLCIVGEVPEAEFAEVVALRLDRAALLIDAGRIESARESLCAMVLELEHQLGIEALRERAIALLARCW